MITFYDQRLRPYIEQKQKKARNFAPTFVPGSQRRIALTQWAIRLIDLPPVTRLAFSRTRRCPTR